MQQFERLQPGEFYHIYNRGINGEALFKERRNYDHFLALYSKYIFPVASTFAYCLLSNHFHLLVKIREDSGMTPDRALSPCQGSDEKPSDPSRQFSHLFNAYTQAINKAFRRTGGLFETPFKRKKIGNKVHLSQLIAYIHMNPQKHGLIDDFKEWPYSSLHAHMSDKITKVERREVITLYGTIEAFGKAHGPNQNFYDIRELIEEDL